MVLPNKPTHPESEADLSPKTALSKAIEVETFAGNNEPNTSIFWGALLLV